MSDLTTLVGTLAYLKDTRFAASDIKLLSGGYSAFTYRIILEVPLLTGEKTVILKHFEGVFSDYDGLKADARRAEFEYKALSALTSSGLFDSNSTVQTPRPIEYDCETQTIFITDLGSPIMLSRVFEQPIPDPYALAAEIGAALGHFFGRFHSWGATPEQAELREFCSLNIASREQTFSDHIKRMLSSAERFGFKDEWIENLAARELGLGSARGDLEVLAMGDLWLDNVLVSLPSQTVALRIYVVDWELVRPARPEYDMGEFLGTAISLARQLYPQGDDPLIPALLGAYRQHLRLDPIRIATETGVNLIGYGTMYPEAENAGDEFLCGVAMAGLELIRLAENEGWIREESVLKDLYVPMVLPAIA